MSHAKPPEPVTPAVPRLIEDALANYAEVVLEERVFIAAHRDIYNGASPATELAWSLLCRRKREAEQEILSAGRIALRTKQLREMVARPASLVPPTLLERVLGR